MTKYHARKINADGHVFDSHAEWRRYCDLDLLKKAGEISDLEVHPRYELQPAFKVNGRTERAIYYEADFKYIDNGGVVIEDVKGVETEVFRLKRKMLLYRYPDLDFRIVKA